MGKDKNKSLCKLVKNKYLKKDLRFYLELVEDPDYVCLKCGRVAVSKKNLCEPEKF